MRRPHRAVVTGIGAITPIGHGAAGLWKGIRAERSAVRTLTRFDTEGYPCRIAAEVDGFDPLDHMGRKSAKRMDRFAHFTVAAGRQALEDAGLERDAIDPTRIGTNVGTALAGIAMAESEHTVFMEEGLRRVDPALALTVFSGSATCSLALEFDLQGPNSANGNSCSSGTIALGEAVDHIRAGRADVMLAGGTEAPLAPLTFGAFANIRAMSTRNEEPERASRPFDAARDGFVMAEGSAILVLERLEHALARDARIYAEILGFGLTNDAYHMVAPRPDGSSAARAMAIALEQADLEPGDLDYINAHGSSTPLNDVTESLAIRSVLGEAAGRVPVTGTKGMTGHALGATGAMEAAITCLAMEHGWIPPTVNLEEPGEGCDLDYLPGGGRDTPIRYALSNSFGFGGINACLVFARDPREIGEGGA